jgi:HSP20 family protein
MEGAEGFFSPKIDITENNDHYTIVAELAGVDKDDLNVSLEDGVLTIEASMEKESTKKEKGKVIRKERHTGSYLRSFNVGHSLAEADIDATFTNGLLELKVPKMEDTAHSVKRIEVH